LSHFVSNDLRKVGTIKLSIHSYVDKGMDNNTALNHTDCQFLKHKEDTYM